MKKADKAKSTILDVMRDNSSITTGELMEILNLGKTSVQKYIKELTKSNLIKRIGGNNGGYWKVF